MSTESAQVAPAKPSSHTHAPVAASHAPFALQSSADAHASARTHVATWIGFR